MEHNTITEKILQAHSDDVVFPGNIVHTRLDLVVGHEVTTPPAVEMLKMAGVKKIFDPDKIALVPDHFVPNKDVQSAELARRLREFAREQGISKYYELGQHGICHALFPEKGLILPGSTVIGADSHTCTYGALGAFSTGIGSTDLAYALAKGSLWFRVPESMLITVDGVLRRKSGVYSKDIILSILGRIGVDGADYMAMEFCGRTVRSLSAEARMTITNMAIEAGAKSGIIAPDSKTREYLKNRTSQPYEEVKSDPDARYAKEIHINAEEISPSVACPRLPSNVRPVSEVRGVKVNQVFIGSCTNGRIEDMRIAASIMKGERVAKNVRMIVIPATTGVYAEALREGLLSTLIDAGAVVGTPTCGPCLGGHMGILAAGEVCVSSSNRNFVGRMGHITSDVYLASPATCAATAISGELTSPEGFL